MTDRHLTKLAKKQAQLDEAPDKRGNVKLRLGWCKNQLATLGKKSELRDGMMQYHHDLCKMLRREKARAK